MRIRKINDIVQSDEDFIVAVMDITKAFINDGYEDEEEYLRQISQVVESKKMGVIYEY